MPPEPPSTRWEEHIPRHWEFVEEHNPQVVQSIRDCRDGNAPWPLFFYGEPGAGKTCAALCLLDWYGSWYYTLASWAARIHDAKFGRLYKSGYQITATELWNGIEYHKTWRPSLFVLDELGMPDEPKGTYTVLHETMARREGIPTILISNLTAEQLGDVYDDRFRSRLEAGTHVEFTGDYRQEQGTQS
jgi:hypothetical protein